MTMISMTGFARGAGSAFGHSWNWEIKSVNNKGLDVRCRFPSFLDGYDLTIKKIIEASLARGSVFVALNITADSDGGEFVINESRLRSLLDFAAKYAGEPGVSPAALDGLLAVKGVVELSLTEISEQDKKSLEATLTENLKHVVEDLNATRADEGARMLGVLNSQLQQVAELADAARARAGNRIEAMNTRFRMQLAKLENVEKPVPDERIAQEIAILAVKSDVQEELDRLDSHVEEARSLLAANKPVGRRLDFLCQEFNREANTLCSKSADSELTKIGLDLKVLVDQFREQVQNIE